MNTPSAPLNLSRNAFGKLVLHTDHGTEPITPVRAFPIGEPNRGISLVSNAGRELAWIDTLSELAEPARSLIEGELAQREFMPEILRIKAVSTFATPSNWEIDTNRGAANLLLKAEEDIRRMGNSLLIADSHGVHFLLRDITALDRQSRRLLDRFL